MLLLLAAVDEGLARACLASATTTRAGVRSGSRRTSTPVGVVTVGHAGPDDRGGSSRKFSWKPLEEVVRWERW